MCFKLQLVCMGVDRCCAVSLMRVWPSYSRRHWHQAITGHGLCSVGLVCCPTVFCILTSECSKLHDLIYVCGRGRALPGACKIPHATEVHVHAERFTCQHAMFSRALHIEYRYSSVLD